MILIYNLNIIVFIVNINILFIYFIHLFYSFIYLLYYYLYSYMLHISFFINKENQKNKDKKHLFIISFVEGNNNHFFGIK